MNARVRKLTPKDYVPELEIDGAWYGISLCNATYMKGTKEYSFCVTDYHSAINRLVKRGFSLKEIDIV